MNKELHQDLSQIPQNEPSGCLPAIVRIVWLALGNAALVILAGLVVREGAFSVVDVIFWTTAGSLIAVRYYDVTRLHGLTAECEPATLQHWRRYSVLLLLISAILWVSAHAIRLITG